VPVEVLPVPDVVPELLLDVLLEVLPDVVPDVLLEVPLPELPLPPPHAPRVISNVTRMPAYAKRFVLFQVPMMSPPLV
jgi:hypothetical protein